MIKKFLALLMAFTLAIAIIGCGDDDDDDNAGDVFSLKDMIPDEANITVAGDVTSDTTPDDWTYFSFQTGSVLDASQKNTTNWDIRILGTKMSTNGGTTSKETGSGGNGGALIVQETDFTKITKAPETGYTSDVVAAIATMAEPKPQVSINPLMTKEDSDESNYDENHWYSGRGSSLNADATKCYVIKCGNGNYARLQFTNYTKDGDNRIYTFSYNYTERADRKLVIEE